MKSYPERRLPGDEGVWFIICADAIFFLLLFGNYSYYRMRDPIVFAQAQAHLHPVMAVVNTLFLLTSSWCVARAVGFERSGQRKRIVTSLGWAILFGVVFVFTKIAEYGVLISSGFELIGSQFFMYYFIITGVHLLHVCAGLAALIVCRAKSASETNGPRSASLAESVGSFWHMIDMLWLFMFPLLYLLRQSVG